MAANEPQGRVTAEHPSPNGHKPIPSKDGDAGVAQSDAQSDAQREHQIKTALAVIYGYATTLDAHWESLADDDRRHGVVAIGRATEDLMSQTERLLKDARRDVAGRARAVARIDIAELTGAEATRWNEGLATAVVVDHSDGPLYAWADASGLQQILSHLVDNAIKYSPGGGEVSIRIGRAGPWIEIVVADEGIGLPNDVNVFAPFQQADAAVDGDGTAGVGLGLHVARTVVEAMGGSLSATTNNQGGSTFVVRLRRLTPAP